MAHLFGHHNIFSKAWHGVENTVGNWLEEADKGLRDSNIGGDIYVGTGTDTMTGPENQRIQTTAYMDNGGYDMNWGSNTAYNENEQNNNKGVMDYIMPLITAGVQTAAGYYINKDLQNQQNKWNAQQAELNRQWQENMSNTAHQREYADLLATGLNPVNTATGGGGAATTGGGQATGTNPAYLDHSSMANTALSLAETMKVLNENKYISPEKKAQIANTIADTTNKSANTEMTHANTNLIKEQTKQIKIDNITREDMNRIEMALKENQSKDVLQSAISKAIENAYHKETGTTAQMTTVERIANIASNILHENITNGKSPDPVGAIQKAIKELEK